MSSKKVVITGASRGIGKVLSEKFLEQGHEVFAISRNGKSLAETQKKYGEEKFKFWSGDLSDIENLNDRLSQIFPWNNLDILYNNAGHIVVKDFQKLDIKDFNDCLSVNFLAPARLIQFFADKMNGSGHIVNIGTMGAVQGSVKFGGLAAYSSSKAALANLTELLAEEWKEDKNKPRINFLAIGAVQTEMLESAFPGYKAPITPEEMADYFYDFGTKGIKFYNGKVLPVSVSTP